MGIGLGLFLIGLALQLLFSRETLGLNSYQILTVVGALLLGWGTGRCDQKACS